MNNWIISFFLLTFVNTALACPNLSGEYSFPEHPWNGRLIVQQKNCDSISLTFLRKATPTPSNPSGDWEFTTNYKADGQAYEGIYDSKQKALTTDRTFHIAAYTSDGVSIVEYSGSQEKCGLNHKFNDMSGNCRKTESRLEFDRNLNRMVWRQIAQSSWKDGWSDDALPIKKK